MAINTKRPAGHRSALVVDIQGREKMVSLAPGTIKPTGWVRDLAQIEADTWLEMAVDPDRYNLRDSLFNGEHTFHGGEWSGYWNDSLIGLSLLLGDADRLQKVKAHIDKTLAEAEKKDKFLSEYYNGWGTHLQIRGLMTYFEATGDERVLRFCHRLALELLDDLNSPDGHAFDGDHPVNMASSCVQLYGYTGDERMVPMAEEIMRRFDIHGLPNMHRLLHADRLEGHCVNYCEDIRHPADVYIFSGNPDHLRASKRGVELTNRDHMQVQGVPTGNEPVHGMGPIKETEHCDAVEWSLVGHSLLTATADVQYADLTEKAIFNSWFGSRKWDGTSLSYNHTPNQLTASTWEGFWPPRWAHSPYHQPQCCNLNSHRAVHPYANRMWMLTPDNGLAAVYYGACELQVELPGAGLVTVKEETAYPFDEQVKIEINPERPAVFPVQLRIPTWCSSAEIKINGESITDNPKSGTFHTITRAWNPGDTIELTLPMPITLQFCETFEEPAFHDHNHEEADLEQHKTMIGLKLLDNPESGKHLTAVTRGPLVYTLYIKPKRFIEPHEENQPGFELESIVPADDAAPWNIALLLDSSNPEASFQFTKLDTPTDGAPFQHAPVALKCKAKIVPTWKPAGTPDKPLTTLPDFPVQVSDEEVEALLIPFGCTNIRLTWLPFVFE